MSYFSKLRFLVVQLRELVFWPLLFALSPLWLQRLIAQHVQKQSQLYSSEVKAMCANILHYLPSIDLASVSRELRLVLLIDKSDVFFSTFRLKHSLKHRIAIDRLPDVHSAALILSAHRGNGWWILPVLNHQGRPVHLVSAPLPAPVQLVDYLLRPYQLLRWHAMNTLGGVPIIPMKGASQKVRQLFADRGRLIAVIDIPPVLAKGCSPVRFFNRTAYMPMQSIQLAFEAGVPVYFCNADFDLKTFKQHIDFERVDSDGGPQAVADRYAQWLEAHIRRRPGSWHAWGHVDDFFKKPNATVKTTGALTGKNPAP